MRALGESRVAIALLTLVVALTSLPGAGLADDDDNKKNGPDLKVEYVGWDAARPGLVTFKVTNVGNAPSAKTTGKGETLAPPPSQETAPPIEALAPKASVEILYPVYPAELCDNHRVRMSVPLANDRNPKDNTVEAILCRKDRGVDLKLDYLGRDPSNAQLVTFRVTNVGVERSEATTARVETLAPPPAQQTAPPIPALEPEATFEFPYALFGTTGCDNHAIKASVPLAKDRYPINNTRQEQVCGPKPPPPPPPPPVDDLPVVVGPAPRVDPIPEHRRSGEHTHTFTEPLLAWAYDADVVTGDGSCKEAGFYGYALAVGWLQREVTHDILGVEIDDCNAWYESQVGVEFDLSFFDDVPDPSVTRAELRFTERPLRWTDGDGHSIARPGCVAHVDIATENWHQPNSSRFPLASEPYRDVPPGTVHRIDVRSATNQQVRNERPRHGFILRGALGLNQLEGQSDESCVSKVEGLQLVVTYVVP